MSHPPYVWPWNGDRRPENTALIIIDLQTDFCGTGGYVDMMGSGLSMTQAPIALINSLLTAMRATGCTIIRAREGHRPDLADLPPTNVGAASKSARAAATPAPAARS